METWKPIKDYEGLYEVSDLGNVRNANTKRILKGGLKGHGYLGVSLYDADGNERQIYIHRLVAQAFCDNPNNKKTVNHINENKKDNRAMNLEWMSIQENLAYGTRMQKVIKKKINGYGSKKVSKYTLDEQFIKTYPSIAQAARENNCAGSNIRNAISGKYAQCAGYVWRYADKGK